MVPAWYSIPPDLSSSEQTSGSVSQWSTAKARMHRHMGPEDELSTLVARSDVCRAPCRECPLEKQKKSAVTIRKVLDEVLMPATLALTQNC